MEQPYTAAADIDVLSVYFPIPGFGGLPINAFVIKGQEPVLVDAGPTLDGDGNDATEAFMDSLRQVIDPVDLKWIWLTHTDRDHVGSLQRVLEAAPNARVVTTFLAVGKMNLSTPLPMDRVYLLNPGERLDLKDRVLTAVKPPSFDAPETVGLYDSKSRALFSSDCFGALTAGPTEDAADLSEADLREGQLTWATIDVPWLHQVDPRVFGSALQGIREMSPDVILSAHLPPARGMTEQLLANLAAAPAASPFVGPNQAELEAMIAEITGEDRSELSAS